MARNVDKTPSMAAAKRRRAILLYIPMSVLALIFIFPLIFMFVSSLKPDAQILADVDSFRAFLPVGDISLANYEGVFDRVPLRAFPSTEPPRSCLS